MCMHISEHPVADYPERERVSFLFDGRPMTGLAGQPIAAALLENGVSGYLTEDDEQMARDLLKIFADPEHRKYLADNAKRKFESINDADAYKQAIADCYN